MASPFLPLRLGDPTDLSVTNTQYEKGYGIEEVTQLLESVFMDTTDIQAKLVEWSVWYQTTSTKLSRFNGMTVVADSKTIDAARLCCRAMWFLLTCAVQLSVADEPGWPPWTVRLNSWAFDEMSLIEKLANFAIPEAMGGNEPVPPGMGPNAPQWGVQTHRYNEDTNSWTDLSLVKTNVQFSEL